MKKEVDLKLRSKIIIKKFCENFNKEHTVKWFFIGSGLYALVSNLLLHCSPLDINPTVLYYMAAVDETLRNCSYGIFASITFYLINDFYKNIYSKVDLYNEMYPDLYNLWLKVYQLVLSLTDYNLNEKQSNDEIKNIILNNIRLKDNKGDNTRQSHIPIDYFHLLYVLWLDADKDKTKFLHVYGNIISRVEYSKLDDKENDLLIEELKQLLPKEKQFTKGMTVTMDAHALERLIYIILLYKSNLATMVNEYSEFYYCKQPLIRKDAF